MFRLSLSKIFFMLESKKSAEFYKNLEDKLALDTKWPAPYLYKFIVPTDPDKIAAIVTIFKDQKADISTRASSKGSFTSVSVKLILENPQAVVKNYKAVASVEGVISL